MPLIIKFRRELWQVGPEPTYEAWQNSEGAKPFGFSGNGKEFVLESGQVIISHNARMIREAENFVEATGYRSLYLHESHAYFQALEFQYEVAV